MLLFIFTSSTIAAVIGMLLKVDSLDPYSDEAVRGFMAESFAKQRQVTKLIVLGTGLALLSLAGTARTFELQSLSALILGINAYLVVGTAIVTLKAPQLKFSEVKSDPLLQALALTGTWPLWIFNSGKARASADDQSK